MKKAIDKVVDVLKGVSTLDTIMRNLTIILLLLITIMALVGVTYGGHSTLDLVDPSFNPNIRTLALSCKTVRQILPLPDGKMLVAGTFNTYEGQPIGGLVRLNADATLDPTFNSDLPSEAVESMVLQPDGKILVLAVRPTYGLIRLNADGSPDAAFNSLYSPTKFAIDASGRIILGGSFFINGGNRSFIRLNSDGSLDPTFQSALNVFQVNTLAVQNNKIIIGIVNNPSAIQRLNEDGTSDSSFMTRNFWALNMIVQPDGKILFYDGSALRRLNQNGSDDPGFAATSFPASPNWQQVMALSNDGKITFAVPLGGGQGYQIRRFLPNGDSDGSFTPYTAQNFSSLAVQADGGVLIGDSGSCPNQPFTNDFVRLLPNGSLDRTFDTGNGFQSFAPSNVRAIDIQPDQKILIGGNFHVVNDVPQFRIARLNSDSTLDSSFQINTGGTGNYFTGISYFDYISTLSDGKIVVGGSFSYRVNGLYRNNVARLNSDGSIDPTFSPGFSVGLGWKVKTYSDGSLLIGTGSTQDGSYPSLTRLLANGDIDHYFYPFLYPGRNVIINALEIQEDEKVIVGGWTFDPDTNIYSSFLTRINADGSLDTTFQPYERLDRDVRAIVLQPNGKIVISESLREESSPSRPSSVLRLNANGSIDPTFNAGTGANGQVDTMLRLSTGRICVGGRFTNFNGQPRGNLVQLNADGSVFSPVYNLNDEVLSLAVDGTGRVFVGGAFTTVVAGNSGAPRSYVAALIDEFPNSTRFDFDGDGRADLATYLAADGMWSILNSRDYQIVATHFGLSADKTVAADYDGDLRTDIAVFRPANGTWYLLRSRGGFGAVQWGADGDKPVTGDYDGDGKADFAVWRPATGVWWILKSSNDAPAVVRFGLAGDVPLSHVDFDGDRKSDIAVWRPSNGHFYWLASGSNNRFSAVHFGQNGDIPAAADYNGDGKTDLVVFRPADRNWYRYLTTPNGEYSFSATTFGMSGDEPVAADYDGDGKTDIAVRRGSEWHILNSALEYSVQIFGDTNARAVASFSIQ